MVPRLGWPAVWGIGGVVALLAKAIVRLVPLVLELLQMSLTIVPLVILAVWIGGMAYAEGYRGFHRQFSPRVVARALHLSAHPRPLHVALAPLYCMGLIHATRRRLITSWAVTLGVVVLVVGVRYLPQPWRGIVDAGVIAGLAIGTASIVYFTLRAIRGEPLPVAPDVPA